MSGRVSAARQNGALQILDAGGERFSEFVGRIDPPPSPYDDFGQFLRSIEGAIERLPRRLSDTVLAFSQRRYAGAMLIRNLPVPSALPETPTAAFSLSRRAPVGSEPLVVAIGRLLGIPFSFVEWEAKLVVHNKFPIPSHANYQFGSGSVEFLLHTETPFRDFSPDYVTLFCLRGDPDNDARTGLCDLRAVVEARPSGDQELFRLPLFAFETDNPIVTVDGRKLTEPRPIVRERDGITQYEYVDDLVGTNASAESALASLRQELHKSITQVNLVAGDLLILDNVHMIHGRSAFRPRYNGKDRWLQRLLVSRRLDPERLAASGYLIHDRCIGGYPAFYQKLLDSLNPATSEGGIQ